MKEIRVGIVVVSDRAARSEREDRCVEALKTVLPTGMAKVMNSLIVPDEVEEIRTAVKKLIDDKNVELVLTSGGTGLGPRDVTPEALLQLIEREVPGIPELMRASGVEKTPTAILSRSVAGTVGKALLIALPGSPKGAAECLSAVWPAIPHAIDILRGRVGECAR